jgi:hypothetical protein
VDFRKPLLYRGLDLNGVVIDAAETDAEKRAGRLVGIQIEDFVVGSVQGVGYTEKRSNDDGRDASDVYLDSRRLIAQGTVYGASFADAHDRFQQLCSIISPTGAFLASPGSYGYLPLTWMEATDDPRFEVDEDDLRFRTVFCNARPLIVPERRWTRDKQGTKANLGQAVQFTAYWEAIDPRIYVDPYYTHEIDGASGIRNGTFLHRGDYPAPLNVLLEVASGQAQGTVTITAGGVVMVITVPDEDDAQTIRYNGALKVLTVTINDIETQRQDLLTATTEAEHPKVDPTPLGDDEAAWSVNSTIALAAGSRLWFHEAFA